MRAAPKADGGKDRRACPGNAPGRAGRSAKAARRGVPESAPGGAVGFCVLRNRPAARACLPPCRPQRRPQVCAAPPPAGFALWRPALRRRPSRSKAAGPCRPQAFLNAVRRKRGGPRRTLYAARVSCYNECVRGSVPGRIIAEGTPLDALKAPVRTPGRLAGGIVLGIAIGLLSPLYARLCRACVSCAGAHGAVVRFCRRVAGGRVLRCADRRGLWQFWARAGGGSGDFAGRAAGADAAADAAGRRRAGAMSAPDPSRVDALRGAGADRGPVGAGREPLPNTSPGSFAAR